MAAVTRFLIGDFGKMRRRRLAHRERRPLTVAFVTGSPLKTDEIAAAIPAKLAPLINSMGPDVKIVVRGIDGMNGRQIRSEIKNLRLRNVDLIIADSPKAVRIASDEKLGLPLLQVVWWVCNPAAFDYLSDLRALWKNRRAFANRWRRDRAALAAVDQVLLEREVRVSPLARLLLKFRNPKRFGTDRAKDWQFIFDEVRLWAPYRTRPVPVGEALDKS